MQAGKPNPHVATKNDENRSTSVVFLAPISGMRDAIIPLAVQKRRKRALKRNLSERKAPIRIEEAAAKKVALHTENVSVLLEPILFKSSCMKLDDAESHEIALIIKMLEANQLLAGYITFFMGSSLDICYSRIFNLHLLDKYSELLD